MSIMAKRSPISATAEHLFINNGKGRVEKILQISTLSLYWRSQYNYYRCRGQPLMSVIMPQ